MGEVITNSYNLFVDSSRNHTAGSKGDDFMVNLQDAGVHAGEGEHIRLSLDNFSMANVITNINANNNHVRVRARSSSSSAWYTHGVGAASTDYIDFELDNVNHTTVHSLATDFKDKLIKALNDFGDIGTVSLKPATLKPEANSDSTDNIIKFKLDHDYGAPFEVYIQMYSEMSDSFAILGGDRIEGDVPTTNATQTTNRSVQSSATSTQVTVTCFYPAQLSTEPFVYIRAPGVVNTNIETKGLKSVKTIHKADTEHSDIVGRAVVTGNEWIQYTARTGREFFLEIKQPQLSFLRLRLTDSRNRPLGRRSHVSNTATGTANGTNQSTLGNLNFSAVIRFDIVKSKNVQHLESQHYVPNVPARFSSGIVNQLRDGKDTFGIGPGY